MITTDTTKLFIHNSGLTWRILFYMAVIGLIIGGIGFAATYPFISTLSELGVFTEIKDLLIDSLGGGVAQIFGGMASLFVGLGQILLDNLGYILPLFAILFVVVGFLGGFLIGISEMAIADCLYGYMGSNNKIGFMNALVKNLVFSIKLQLAKFVVMLPFNLITILALFGALMLYFTGNFWLVTFAPFIVILVLTLLLALRNTIFSAWVPCAVVKGQGVWQSLGESVSDVFKNFGRIYIPYFLFSLAVVAVTIAAISLTACVALIITIPACVLAASVVNMVLYFNRNGLKYYVDNNEIVTPNKKEVWDNVYSLKYVI